MRDKVLSKIILAERVILGLVFAFLAIALFKHVSTQSYRFERSDLMLFFYICVFVIAEIKKLRKRRKLRSAKLSSLIYGHSTERWRTRKLGVEFFGCALLSLLIICFACVTALHLPHESSAFWYAIAAIFILSVILTLELLKKFIYSVYGYEAKITVALHEKALIVSTPIDPVKDAVSPEPFYLSADEIADAYVTGAEAPTVRQYVLNEYGKLKSWITPNKKLILKDYCIMCVFMLSDRLPASEERRMVNLQLRSGRHVLIETDDAENFAAALRKVIDLTPTG